MEKGIRLAHLMALRGLTSRRTAEEWIRDGRVAVNGTIVEHPLVLVDPDEDHVRVDGRPLPPAPPKVYYLLYKPKGYITGRDDPEGRRGIHELLEGIPYRLEPVGRLDFDTEGALILTNDGDLAHALMHPSNMVPRRYLAKVYRAPSDADIRAVEQGVYLEDGRTTPGKMRLVEMSDGGNAWVEVTVTEGRNRLIRRMFAQLGHPVSKLRRESFATVSIRGMERGQFRLLTGAEVRRLQEIATGKNPQNTGKKKKGFAIAKPKGRPQARKKKLARR